MNSSLEQGQDSSTNSLPVPRAHSQPAENSELEGGSISAPYQLRSSSSVPEFDEQERRFAEILAAVRQRNVNSQHPKHRRRQRFQMDGKEGNRDRDDERNNPSNGFKGRMPVFKGGAAGQGRSKMFLHEFETWLDINSVKLNDPKAVQYFSSCLKGPASHWYQMCIVNPNYDLFQKLKSDFLEYEKNPNGPAFREGYGEKLKGDLASMPLYSYSVLKARFMKRFIDINMRNIAKMDIQACKLSHFASVDEYNEEMEDLFSRVEGGLDEETMLTFWTTNCDVEGFGSYLMERAKDFGTYLEAYQVARMKENGLKLDRKFVPYNEIDFQVNTTSRAGPSRSTKSRDRTDRKSVV